MGVNSLRAPLCTREPTLYCFLHMSAASIHQLRSRRSCLLTLRLSACDTAQALTGIPARWLLVVGASLPLRSEVRDCCAPPVRAASSTASSSCTRPPSSASVSANARLLTPAAAAERTVAAPLRRALPMAAEAVTAPLLRRQVPLRPRALARLRLRRIMR